MGLDAYVPCRCWRDGACAAPPFDPSWLVLDAEYEPFSLAPEHYSEDLDDRLWQWIENACSHKDMKIVSARIGSWPQLWPIKGSLDEESPAFPVLESMLLGRANDGSTTARDCSLALTELDALEVHGELVPALVEMESGWPWESNRVLGASYDEPELLAVVDGRLAIVRGGAELLEELKIDYWYERGTRQIRPAAITLGDVVFSSSNAFYEIVADLDEPARPRRSAFKGGMLSEGWGEAPKDQTLLQSRSRITDMASGDARMTTCIAALIESGTHLQMQLRGAASLEYSGTIHTLRSLCQAAADTGSRLYYC